MKLQITVLKAPWPKGAKVGDIVEALSIPGWALGKCVQVSDEIEATVAFEEREDTAEHPEVARLRDEIQHTRAAAEAEFDRMRDAHASEVRNLKADHAAALAELEKRIAEATAGAGQQVQDLTDQVAKLTADLAQAKADHAAAMAAATAQKTQAQHRAR